MGMAPWFLGTWHNCSFSVTMFSRCCFSTCHFNWWRAYSVISNCQNILVASELSMKIFRSTLCIVHGCSCCYFFFRGVDWSSHYGIFFLAVKKANRGVKYRKRYTINTRLCSKKKKIEEAQCCEPVKSRVPSIWFVWKKIKILWLPKSNSKVPGGATGCCYSTALKCLI